MPKKTILIIGAGIAVVGAGFFFLQKTRTPLSPQPLNSPEISHSRSKHQAREIIATKLPTPTEKKEPPQCEGVMGMFAHKSVKDFIQYLLETEIDGRCISESVKLPEAFGGFDDCKKLKANPTDPALMEACAQFLTFSRAFYVDQLTQEMTEYDSMELSLLLNKILAQMRFMEKHTPEQLQKWREMTAAAVRRMPENLQAVKAHLVTFLVDKISKEQFQEGAELQTYINEGLKIDPEDPQLTELLLHGDSLAREGRQKIEDFVGANPNNALGHYHLAEVLWRSGDKNGALRELDTALALSPGDARIQRTLADANRYPAGKKHRIFELQLGFQFNDL